MKNQYITDIIDYGKYSLIRAFAKAGITIGINWYLTEDDGSSDGKSTQYLYQAEKMRKYDPVVFDTLKAINENEELLGIIRAVGDGFTIVFIQDLLVHPKKQHQGVGTALLNAVLKRYPCVRQIELTTDNKPETIAFYKSLGFREYSEIGCCGLMRYR